MLDILIQYPILKGSVYDINFDKVSEKVKSFASISKDAKYYIINKID